MRMRIIVTALALTACAAALGYQAETPAVKTGAPPPQATVSSRDALIARAKSLELNTPYVPPPGDPLEHRTSGFAKIMCSAVFITGLDPDFAAENVGYFTSPYAERAKVGKPVIDRINKAVHITLPNGVTRTAKYLGDQGCVTLPVGKTSVNFTPVKLKSHLPDDSTHPCLSGRVRAIRALRSELPTSCRCRAGCESTRPRTQTTIRRAPILITCISTQVVLTPSIMPPPARYSGRPPRWPVIATPTLY